MKRRNDGMDELLSHLAKAKDMESIPTRSDTEFARTLHSLLPV